MNPRFLLLHGFTGSPNSWDAVRDALPRSAQVEAPVILGHDATGEITTASFEEEVDRLARRAEELFAGDRAHLAGYSQGGRLAVGLMVRHPRLWKSATLIGASPGLDDGARRQERRKLDEDRARQILEEGLETFIEGWEALPLFASQRTLPEAVRAAQRAERLAHRPTGLARALRVLGTGAMPNYWPALDQIAVPVRLVVGEYDAKFLRLATAMAERLGRASLEIVPDVGHNVVLEAPRRVAAALVESQNSSRS